MHLNLSIEFNQNIPVVRASFSGNKKEELLLRLIAEHRTQLVEKLNQYGMLLFRGFACEHAEYFSNLIAECNFGKRCSTRDYDLPRTVLANEIYTSSDLPGNISIPLHHEKPRSKNPPHHLYFCCVRPAEKRGGTIFANAEFIWNAMPITIQQKIIELGVVYKQFFHGKTLKYQLLKKILNGQSVNSWADYFYSMNKAQIEEKLQQEGLSYKWHHKCDGLIVLNKLPGVLTHPLSKKKLWFNSSAYLHRFSLLQKLKNASLLPKAAAKYLSHKDMLPLVCHYGDGQPFSFAEAAKINHLMEQFSWVFTWEKGDFLIVDNFTYMHGKEPHEGNRLLYSCMTISE